MGDALSHDEILEAMAMGTVPKTPPCSSADLHELHIDEHCSYGNDLGDCYLVHGGVL